MMILPSQLPKKAYPPCLPPEKCLAKTLHNGPGCSIYDHLAVTCRMFRLLREVWQGTRKGAFFFPAGEWCAACHDIGKMTPAFQEKLYQAIRRLEDLPWSSHIEEDSRGHALSSAVILEKYFRRPHPEVIRIIGGHHGKFNTAGFGDTTEKTELGGPEWQSMREVFLDRLSRDLQLPDCGLDSITEEQLPLILGSVILADWLSSSLELSPGSPPPEDVLLKHTIETAGLVPHEIRAGLDFRDLFGFSPNQMQTGCLQQIVPGGIYVIESGMGSGKTEAALALAYELLRRKQADGLYFALPTQLTSEKIFARLNLFLEKTVSGRDVQAILIHGDSWLDWDLPDPDGDGTTDHAGSWFQSKKRALLASFGAGTADQALMSVVRVRHNALRAFALAGKVIIIDEIHSYDAYTGSLLAKLIASLRNWGCTVILLSATLTAEACRKFAQLKEPPKDDCYPRILLNDHGKISILPVPAGELKHVTLRMTDSDDAVLKEAIARASSGEQVLWIENTVRQAQEIFRRLSVSAPKLEIGLIHSRFPVCVRSVKEDRWTELLGKNGAAERIKRGRILVATQVLEQSVDVDADLLVTRIAPADFIFQRIGRLWRHPCLDPARPRSAVRQAVVLAPDSLADPEKLKREKKSFRPYDAYWIRRTWEALHERGSLALPSDIRPVLEQIYQDRDEQDSSLNSLKNEMTAGNEKLQLCADIATAELREQEDDDEWAPTRISEEQQVQLLLIRKGNLGEKWNRRIHAFFGNEPIEIPDAASPRREFVAAARKILPLMLKIPDRLAPSWDDFPADFLRNIIWTGDDNGFHPVRTAYIDDSGHILDQACNIVVTKNGYQLAYHEKTGYICIQTEEGKW